MMVSGRDLIVYKSKRFPSKILLAGEFSVLAGSEAFIMPYPNFNGYLDFFHNNVSEYERRSHTHLQTFSGFCQRNSDVIHSWFNIESYLKDVEAGVYFRSNIPENYGMGSSGALVAAIYNAYGEQVDDLNQLRSRLAILESFFHGKSSGTDALCSLTNSSLHIKGNEIIRTDNPSNSTFGKMFLYDSGIKAGTSHLVMSFMEKMNETEFRNFIRQKYAPLVNQLVTSVLNTRKDVFFSVLAEISTLQLSHFGEYIPLPVQKIWKEGLRNEDYFMKLCGSGGGGYFLIFFRANNLVTMHMIDSKCLVDVTIK